MLLLLLACHTGKSDADALTYDPTCDDADPVTLSVTPTWSSGVGALVAEKCGGCHVDGGIAPFPLTTYAAAAPMASAMAAAVAARTMPPWLPTACGECQTWQHDRSLTEEQIATLRAWADGGAPEGDGGTFDPPALAALDRVDATVDPGESYTPPASPTDTYRCFVVNAPSTAATWITGFDVHPGNPAVVHHAILYAPESLSDVTETFALDAADDGPGYTCFGGPGVNASPVALWAPGAGAIDLPAGTGLSIAAAPSLVLQVHYNVANGTGPDETSVDLRLEDDVATPAAIEKISETDIELPPGQDAIEVDHEVTLDVGTDVKVWGIAPHMHQAGRSITLRANSGGEDVCLVDVPAWDFHWQGMFFYQEPVTLAGDSTITLTCVYDTSDRTETTYAGEGTEDEMCLAFAYVSAG
jgi:hypothetical protein